MTTQTKKELEQAAMEAAREVHPSCHLARCHICERIIKEWSVKILHRLTPLVARLEEQRIMQLAAISTQAFSNTKDSVDMPLECHNDYKTTALFDVNKAIHREIEHRNNLTIANARIAELTAQVAAKDAALRRASEGRILHAESMDFDDATMAEVCAALSPTCAEGWLSPAEAERLLARAEHHEQQCKTAHSVLDALFVANGAANSDAGLATRINWLVPQRERSAQIRALKWAANHDSLIPEKVEQIRTGGPLI